MAKTHILPFLIGAIRHQPDTIHIRPLPTNREKLWKKATVIKQVAPRSYEVDLQGKVYRRNRRHLVKTSESSPPKFEPDISLPIEELQPSTSEEASNSSEPLEQAQGFLPVASENLQATPVTCTRSGRTVRLPKRFQDILRCFRLCLLIYRVFCCLFQREGRCDNMHDIIWQYC